MNLSIPQILQSLFEGRQLADDAMRWVVGEMMAGRMPDPEAAAVLTALRMKGETSQEIAVAAQVLRLNMLAWDSETDDVLDTCGTGGDGSGTFNISTATALVAAGAGAPIVKHGNRSVSSRSGSADVLQALGVKVDGDVDFVRRCLREANFAFCYAPRFHPAMKHVAAVRRALGVPTIFNCLGPLANPAGAKRQLLGVGRRELLDPMAGALARLGIANAYVLCSSDGLDEVSLAAPTMVRHVRDHSVNQLEWTADDFQLAECTLKELAAEDIDVSARMIECMLMGEEGAPYRIVLANAAAALLAAGRVAGLLEGVAVARHAVKSGAALQVLETLRRLSQGLT